MGFKKIWETKLFSSPQWKKTLKTNEWTSHRKNEEIASDIYHSSGERTLQQTFSVEKKFKENL